MPVGPVSSARIRLARMLPRGIRGRLFLLIVAVLLPVAMLLGSVYHQRYEARKADAIQAESEMADALATTFEVYIEGVRRHLETLDMSIMAFEPYSDAKAVRLLTDAAAQYPAVRNLSWLSPDGRVLASSDATFIGGSLLPREYIRRVIAGKNWTMSNLLPTGTITPSPTIGLAVPARDKEGRLTGIMLAGIEPDRLGELVLTADRAADGSYAIFDGNGVLVYRNPEAPLNWQQRVDWLKGDPVLRRAIQTGQPQSAVVGFPSTMRGWLLARAPVASTGYFAGAGRPMAAVMADINRDLFWDAILGVIVLTGSLVLAYVVALTIARPIIRLETDARATGDQVIERRNDPSAPQEVVRLRMAIESLVDDLVERASRLRQYELLSTHNRDIMLFIRRDDGRILEANKAAEKAYGYSRQQLLSMTVYDLRAADSAGPQIDEQISAADQGGMLFETVHRRSDGQDFPVEVSSRGATINNQRILVSVIRDITERKKADEQLRDTALFPEEDPFPVIRISADGTVLYANPACSILTTWGCESGIGAPKKVRTLAAEALAAGQGREWTTIAGGRHFSFVFTPLVDRDYVNVYGRDITDLKHAERALKDYSRKLEQRVRERTAELRVRADQLRMLAGELALAEQRERRRLARVLHDHLQQLLVGAKFRTAALGRTEDPFVREASDEIDRLLAEAIAASRSLTAELSPPILHQAGLNAGLQWLVRWMSDKHGLNVRLDMDGDLPDVPDDIKVLLFESVRELLFNVVKHAGTDAAQVSFRLVNSELAEIVVSDSGVGFDTRAIKLGDSKAGFGLFSIRERLEQIGGQMKIDSRPGKGSRFTLLAPLEGAFSDYAEPDLPGSGRLSPDRKKTPRAATPSGRIRILLADDHAVMREGLVRLLDAEPDIDVIGEAGDGQEAIALARELLPDVILMDLSMPKMNGIEATRVIHAEQPHVRIIGLSMFDAADSAQAMTAAGAVAYRTKSGPAADLIAAIRSSVASETASSTSG